MIAHLLWGSAEGDDLLQLQKQARKREKVRVHEPQGWYVPVPISICRMVICRTSTPGFNRRSKHSLITAALDDRQGMRNGAVKLDALLPHGQTVMQHKH